MARFFLFALVMQKTKMDAALAKLTLTARLCLMRRGVNKDHRDKILAPVVKDLGLWYAIGRRLGQYWIDARTKNAALLTLDGARKRAAPYLGDAAALRTMPPGVRWPLVNAIKNALPYTERTRFADWTTFFWGDAEAFLGCAYRDPRGDSLPESVSFLTLLDNIQKRHGKTIAAHVERAACLFSRMTRFENETLGTRRQMVVEAGPLYALKDSLFVCR
jgi:hypothetical protein